MLHEESVVSVLCVECGGFIYQKYLHDYSCVRCGKRYNPVEYHSLWLVQFRKENHEEIDKLRERSLF